MMDNGQPERIVCLTEETTEWLYILGEQDRIVGISAFTERPETAKEEKPVVSAFIGGSVKKIKELKPDLVIGFSDVQADLAQELIKENLQVLITNQRSLEDIFNTLLMVGRLVDAEKRAQSLVDGYRERIRRIRNEREQRDVRPRVYFEEWDDPMISGIQWVSELIEIAGGENIFADRAEEPASKNRETTAEEVIERAPEIYISCWCGKPLDEAAVRARDGFDAIPAFKEDRIYEMNPASILQPGPACLTDGLDELCDIIDKNLP